MMERMSLDDIKSLKIGDRVCEAEYGAVIHCEVKSIPVCSKNEHGTQWSWVMTDEDTGHDVDYLVTEGLMHYGPKLYWED